MKSLFNFDNFFLLSKIVNTSFKVEIRTIRQSPKKRKKRFFWKSQKCLQGDTYRKSSVLKLRPTAAHMRGILPDQLSVVTNAKSTLIPRPNKQTLLI